MNDKYTDQYGDELYVDTLSNEERAYLKAPMLVSLTPKQVKALRKQLKKWLVENGHVPAKT